MFTVYRYTQIKPRDGKLEFSYHRDGTILGFTETWRREGGWMVAIDVLVDTTAPVERRRFLLCTAGDDLTPLGENAFAYHIGTNASKGYCSYLFDITHLSEQVIVKLEANWERLQRRNPDADEKSYRTKLVDRTQREREDRDRKRKREQELEEKRRRINERAGVLEGTVETVNKLMDSRAEADAARERIENGDVPHLRAVEGT